MRFLTSVLGILILVGAIRADDEPKPWEIQGQVVDEHGKPVDDFEAASYWSSNGKHWNDAGEWIKSDDYRDLWKSEGVLAAYPARTAKQLPNGNFSLTVDDWPRVSVFAIDKDHKRGGIVSVESDASAKPVTIKLAPLVRVHGKVYCADANCTPDWTMAIVHPPGDTENFLHFIDCGSVLGKFEFLLPPGKYDLDVYSSDPDARMLRPAERKLNDSPADMPPYIGGIRIEVPPQADLDLGTLNVELPRDKNGAVHSYFLFYGKEPPPLSITDARGVSKNVKLSDFRGRWVLIDFWSLGCHPCVEGSLPKLAKLYEEYAADRNRFEILAICNTADDKANTFAAFDPLVAPIVERVWAGKQLPFPVLLDGEGRTYGDYGIRHLPTTLLIDPEGHLVKDGDEKMLIKKLKEKH